MDETQGSPESEALISLPPPLPVERRAAWWAWPIILLCLIPLDPVMEWLAPLPDVPASESGAGEADPSELALLKLQGQVVIASAKIDPEAAGKSLDELDGMVSGDRSIAALALLESFVQVDSPRSAGTLARFSESGAGELATLTGLAVREGVGEEDRDRLRGHLGWFADLARGPDLAAPPLDSSIRARSFLVLVVLGLVMTTIGFALLFGAGLLILHLRRVQSGVSVNAFVPSRRHTGVLLECFALYLGIMTFGAFAGYWWGQVGGIGCYVAAVVVPLVWPRLRGVRWGEFCRLVGLHRGKGWLREMGAGAVGYLGVLAIASIGISITLALTLLAGAVESGGSGGEGTMPGAGGPAPGPEVHPIVGWIYEGDLWTRLACLFLAAGFAPLFEELFFRGALQRYFRGRFRFLLSALFSAVIFAALHPQGLYAIPALAGIGVGFSLLREWRDSLIAPMTAHAINNGCLVGMLWWIL